MSQHERFIENRNEVDSAIQMFLLDTRGIVCDLVEPLAAQGRFSLENIPTSSRGNLRTVDDIAMTMDPTALLAVLMECMSDRSRSGLKIPGVSFQLVDSVRRIRNDHAHGGGNYSDRDYVRYAVKMTNDLRSGLLSAKPRLRVQAPEVQEFPETEIGRRTRTFFEAYSRGYSGLALPIAREGIDPTIVNSDGLLPLHLAITKARQSMRSPNHASVVEALIASGANVNGRSPGGEPALNLAVQVGHVEIVKVLVSAGADPHAEYTLSRIPSPLHLAIRLGMREIIKALLSAGTDVNAQTSSGRTLLHTATQRGDIPVVKALIDAGANVNAPSADGEIPLHEAARRGDKAMMKTLIAAGADVTAVNDAGSTPRQLEEKFRNAVIRKRILIWLTMGLSAIVAAIFVLFAVFN